MGIQGAYINNVLYHRRRRMNSLTSKHIDELPIALECIIDRHPKYFSNEKRIKKAKYNVFYNNPRYDGIYDNEPSVRYLTDDFKQNCNSSRNNKIFR